MLLILQIIIIIISVLPSGRSLAPGPWPLPFPQSLLLTGCCMQSRRDTHGSYRLWHFIFFWDGSSSFLSWLLRSPFTICKGAVGQFLVPRSHRVITSGQNIIIIIISGSLPWGRFLAPTSSTSPYPQSSSSSPHINHSFLSFLYSDYSLNHFLILFLSKCFF